MRSLSLKSRIIIPFDKHGSTAPFASSLHQGEVDLDIGLKLHEFVVVPIDLTLVIIHLVVELQYNCLEIIEQLFLRATSFNPVGPRPV